MTMAPTIGLCADVRQYLKAAMSLTDRQITTVGLAPDQIGTPGGTQPTIILVQPVGGIDDGNDLVHPRLQVRVAAKDYSTARATFEQVRTLLRRYPYSSQPAARSQDYGYPVAEGIEIPTHGVDFYFAVPEATPV